MSTDVPLELGDVAVQGHKESSLSIALLHAAALLSFVAGEKLSGPGLFTFRGHWVCWAGPGSEQGWV